MIYVTQGHEKGIGLEIFLKSFLLLSSKQKKHISLIVTKDSLAQNFKDLRLKRELFKELQIIEPSSDLTPSTASLLHALKIIQNDDLLVTLPTSKDQLILNGKNKAGYTEFFRDYYTNDKIAMTFRGYQKNVVLVTDHVALKDVPLVVTSSLIEAKVSTCIDFYKKYFSTFDEVIVSGLNPHVGENGILGNEDAVISTALVSLKKSFPKIKFKGPFSGDTLHVHEDQTKNQLLVYMYHDQGLSKFKAESGLIGLNISMGLPFLRLSVDHGTAFDLYGKNKANYISMNYLFQEAFKVINNVNK